MSLYMARPLSKLPKRSTIGRSTLQPQLQVSAVLYSGKSKLMSRRLTLSDFPLFLVKECLVTLDTDASLGQVRQCLSWRNIGPPSIPISVRTHRS